jgi:hypothetical protein
MSNVGRAEPKAPKYFTMPHVGQRAFLVGASHAFVRDPMSRGRWVLVPRSVIEKACPWCNAQIFEPCHNIKRGNTWTQTHTARRVSHFEANQRRKKVGA